MSCTLFAFMGFLVSMPFLRLLLFRTHVIMDITPAKSMISRPKSLFSGQKWVVTRSNVTPWQKHCSFRHIPGHSTSDVEIMRWGGGILHVWKHTTSACASVESFTPSQPHNALIIKWLRWKQDNPYELSHVHAFNRNVLFPACSRETSREQLSHTVCKR